MEQTLAAVGALLLKAIPTFLLVLLLYVYLKVVFFAPLGKLLDQRLQATEGARKAATAALALASDKSAAYESGIRNARSEIYKEQEEYRRMARQEQAARVAEARGRADQAVKDAKGKIAAEVAVSRQGLAQESDALAERIAGAVLGRVA
jgi:F-type H+-transporting ATPase subunit b